MKTSVLEGPVRALLLSVAVAAITSSTKAQQNIGSEHPKVYFSDSSRLGRPFAKDPSVIHFRDKYLMYYSLPPLHSDGEHRDKNSSGWGIGIASSPDLVTWTKVGEVPQSPGVESSGIAAPGARVIGDKVHLFYQTYGHVSSKDEICHATSDDGIHFAKDPTNPVYHPTKEAWSIGRAIDAEVITVPEKKKVYLYYATRDLHMQKQLLGVAAADLNSGFGAGTWHDLSIDSPVLTPILPWEKICIEAPTVVRHDGRFYLFYAGAYNNEPQQIGVAVSDDGIHFKRLSDEPFLRNGPPGAWNSSESGHPGVLQDRDQTYLFYQGNSDHGQTYYISMVRLVWKDGIPQIDPTWETHEGSSQR